MQKSITLTKTQARRFILAHQKLWPPRQLDGKEGLLDFIRHVGCIQFDPINVVGRNPDLVLQARLKNYSPDLLNEILYTDRLLWDGFDKVASIYHVDDWPYFARQRAAMNSRHGEYYELPLKIAPEVLEMVKARGPVSSIDLDYKESVSWSWGRPSSLVRATLEVLYAQGKLGIHHRIGTRRYFDLIDGLIPAALLSEKEPNPSTESYEEWHVLRRIGGLGLAHPGAGEHWLGIRGVKSKERRKAIGRLLKRGEIVSIQVEEISNGPFYIRSKDLSTIEEIQYRAKPQPTAAFIAPLDNLIWDRKLIRWIFDFEYIWEVYKPAKERQYGYYVLPVLWGDHFIARADFALDRKNNLLTLRGWWWEHGVEQDGELGKALVACFRSFIDYLDGPSLTISGDIHDNGFLTKLFS